MNLSAMKIEFIGGAPNPPLNISWNNGTKLQWKIGVIQACSSYPIGLQIDADANRHLNMYNIQFQFRNISGSAGPMNFQQAWNYLNGMETMVDIIGPCHFEERESVSCTICRPRKPII